MPELPEVQTIVNDLNKKIINKKIVDVVVYEKAKISGKKDVFIKKLKSKKFNHIHRVGKLLIFEITKDSYLLVHLKMTGQLIYRKGHRLVGGGHPQPDLKSEPNKFTRVIFRFADHSELFFNDIRRFGYLKLVDAEELNEIKAQYGPDPLSKDFTTSLLVDFFANKKMPVKIALMNQEVISGLGNIYACEACFLSGIDPRRPANSLTREEIKNLHKSVVKIIKLAVEKRGTTFNNYRDSNGEVGYFASFLKVYDRKGESCVRKDGGKVEWIKMGGRGTFFCPVCQK